MYLRFYGWEGTQFDISKSIKPAREDRNVNIEELAYYARTHAGWLNVQYRVAGNLNLLKTFLANGFPVMIEEEFYLEETYWPNDDHWSAHYQLLTGYDELTKTFIGQDSFKGANQLLPYDAVDKQWRIFNRVYMILYPQQQEEVVKAIIGPDWDVNENRKHALALAQAEAEANPKDAFAWFNVGTNLVFFERYGEAARAYDTARTLGLPQRMLRYQFGPFIAYFHAGRTEDLLELADYALKRTPNSEEALLWKGWALYRKGNLREAKAYFQQALDSNPNYQDARYALDFISH
jgi:tetratricopeptide (TPR) repeat protein